MLGKKGNTSSLSLLPPEGAASPRPGSGGIGRGKFLHAETWQPRTGPRGAGESFSGFCCCFCLVFELLKSERA